MAIKDYFLIGDLHTSALVKDGSIDWFCLPHFDSESIFAKILDKKGGSFSIKNRGYNVDSEYLGATAILKTSFKSRKNSFEVKDFMVPQKKQKCHKHILVRKIKATNGNPLVKLQFNPMTNYGKRKPRVNIYEKELTFRHNKKDIKLSFPEESNIKKQKRGLEISIKLKKNQEVYFTTYQGDCAIEKRDFEKETKNFWKKWVSRGKFVDFCKQRMIRSAITLKLMQFYPTGAIIASPTTSLPEDIGGTRNWDYRYCWIRDATFTLYGLYVLGYKKEAEKFFEFLEGIAKGCKNGIADLGLVYTIDGKEVKKEKKLNHLSGYKNSNPVRIGNNASKQFQLDIYGALIDSYYFMTKRGLKISKSRRKIIEGLVKSIEKNWKKKDNGIWEVRGEKQNFTYSKVMAWVGVDRAIRISDEIGVSNKKKKGWIKLREEIKSWIWKNCFDKSKTVFQQHPKTKEQDATNFLFVLLQFLDKHHPTTKEIINNTRKKLSKKSHFVYRYRGNDGLPGKEGAFILCSFWMISAFAILEDLNISKKLFKKLERNISSLISEEINPNTGEYLGNYPQAFSHLGYIMSAYYLDKYRKKLRKKK